MFKTDYNIKLNVSQVNGKSPNGIIKESKIKYVYATPIPLEPNLQIHRPKYQKLTKEELRFYDFRLNKFTSYVTPMLDLTGNNQHKKYPKKIDWNKDELEDIEGYDSTIISSVEKLGDVLGKRYFQVPRAWEELRWLFKHLLTPFERELIQHLWQFSGDKGIRAGQGTIAKNLGVKRTNINSAIKDLERVDKLQCPFCNQQSEVVWITKETNTYIDGGMDTNNYDLTPLHDFIIHLWNHTRFNPDNPKDKRETKEAKELRKTYDKENSKNYNRFKRNEN